MNANTRAVLRAVGSGLILGYLCAWFSTIAFDSTPFEAALAYGWGVGFRLWLIRIRLEPS